MEGFVTKALREAKRHTSWVHVDEGYEAAALALVRGLLGPGGSFLAEFRPLARRLAFLGMLTSLSRTVLKMTLPGVPDVYQGTEMWDLSLVDPDNRRPVDYETRIRALEADEPVAALLGRWPDGAVKQAVLTRLLADRAGSPHLYATGDYQVLRSQGSQARRVLAFARSDGSERLVVVVPRLVSGMIADGAPPLSEAAWGDTSVAIPGGQWRDAITGQSVEIGSDGARVGELFATLPFSVLRAQV
jgi:(1->4)-alpha-D-glucan 1-alpha-D-glucosylmutase